MVASFLRNSLRQQIPHSVVRTGNRQEPRSAAIERNRGEPIVEQRVLDRLACDAARDQRTEIRRHRDAVAAVAARVMHALEHAAFHVTPGVYNVAADGVLALSEIIGLLGKRPLPALPPWGTGLVAGPLRRLGLRIPDEVVNQLRFGRGVDSRLLKATGFRYGYTTRETVLKLGEHLRLAPVMRGVEQTYTYEREVEEFLHWSPYVRREHPGERGGVAADREPLGI